MRNPAITPRPVRIIVSMNASLLLRLARMISSTRNGKESAIAKGHPSIPPTPNQPMPHAVFSPPLQFMKDDIPNIVQYIAKLEGRKAAEAWNIPGLKIMAKKKKRATRGLSVLLTTRNIMVWHRAQTKARAYRMK